MLMAIGFLSHWDIDWMIKYLLILFKIGFGLTISPLYPIILSELMPEVGYIVSSTLFWGLNTAIIFSFPVLVETKLGFDGIFWLFSGVMIVVFCLISIFMKETKGKTLVEIDEIYC